MFIDDYTARYAIEGLYTKDSIDRGLFSLVRDFYLKDTDPDWQNPETVENTNILLRKKGLIKSEMVKIAYSVFNEEEIYFAFLKTLPPAVTKVIERLVWRDYMTRKEVEVFLSKLADPNATAESPARVTVPNELIMFTTHTPSYNSKYTSNDIAIPNEIKKLILKYYTQPQYVDFIPLQEIPETAYKYNAQEQIFEEIPHFISYYLLGNIKFSSSGRPVESTLSKFQKTCAIDEFYGFDNEQLNKVRCNLIAGMLYNLQQKDIHTDSKDIIKYFFNTHYTKLFTVQFILTELKGWNFVTPQYDRHHIIEERLIKTLKEIPLHDWTSIENLMELLAHRAIDLRPLTIGYDSKLYFETETSDGVTTKISITNDGLSQFITEPFIKGSIFLFAAFGLMEIAFDDVNNTKFGSTYYSNYDGLKYFKLTNLGAYVFGHKSTFEHQEIPTQRSRLSLSNDSLMIIADGETSALTDKMLGAYSEKLGNTRYRVTPESFLRDCKTRKDIESKIALFKASINNSIPTFWDKFFRELINNASAIKINKFVVTYTLLKDDKELHRLVAQDMELKQLALKAEGFNLLVPVENLTKFKSRMKELGFLVE